MSWRDIGIMFEDQMLTAVSRRGGRDVSTAVYTVASPLSRVKACIIGNLLHLYAYRLAVLLTRDVWHAGIVKKSLMNNAHVKKVGVTPDAVACYRKQYCRRKSQCMPVARIGLGYSSALKLQPKNNQCVNLEQPA